MRKGMENIIVNFHCNQMSLKNVIVFYKTTRRILTFLKVL